MFVTGKDRSYVRSIYRLVRNIDEKVGVYRPVAYKGSEIGPNQAKRYTNKREHEEFRPATDEEVRNAGYTARVPLLDLLYKLGIGHNSDY